MLLYLSSKDSVKLQGQDNTWSDFLITLPTPLYIDREDNWEIGLCDMSIEDSKRQQVSKAERIVVYCNLVETSYISDSLQPVLRSVQFRGVKNTVKEFDHVYYIGLTHEMVDSVHIYLRLSDDTIPSLNAGTTKCTLHLRRA